MSQARLVLVRTRSGKTRGLHARFYVWDGESPPDPNIVEREEPVRETIHEMIDFVWDDSPAEGVPAGNFMVEWRGFLHVPEVGVYRFYIIVDDGAKLWIDDKLVIDAWRDQPPTHYISDPIELDVGLHKIRLLYYNHDVFGRIVLGWITPNGDYEPIPSQYLYTRLGDDIVVRGIPSGYRVELRNGFFRREAESRYGIARIPAGDLLEPIAAYFRVYNREGEVIVETPVISDVWGGDEYLLLAR
ncbi:PA14 domain-containing protein [Pyrolobus fumarii]|nr:PA14 domain-containing protein [Pyrolobus fumarii]